MLKYELIDLIELIRCNGDKELMGAFIDEFHQKILNICKGYENEYLETDLIISVINLVYNLNLEKFRYKSNSDLLKYINRSLENRAIDSYRKFKGVKEKVQIYSLESLDYLIPYYDEYDFNEIFESRLKGLTNKQQKVLYFKFVEGLEDKEVAQMLNVRRQSINAIKNRAIKF